MTVQDSAPAPIPIDEKLENHIFRKLSVRLFPLLILGIMIAYIDRANLGVVRAPMSDEVGLSATGFGVAAGVFYFGYLFFEIPSNIAMNKFGARLWLARIMFTWGLVTMLFIFINSDWSLNVLRFLLGAAEAGFYPGVLLYLTFWFPKRRMPHAISAFQVGIPIALALGTASSSGLLLLDGALGLSGWKWVFLVQGAITVVLGVVYLATLPNGPKDAKWLTDDEREYIIAQVAVENPKGTGHGAGAFKQVVKSPLAWTYAVFYFCILLAFWSITYWLPSVVKERFDSVSTVQAGLISAIPWIVCAIVMYATGVTSARSGDRRWHVVIGLTVGGLGLIGSTVFDSPIMVIGCLALAAAGAEGLLPPFYAHASAAFAGATAAVALAFINCLGNISGFIGPYVMGLLTDMTGNTKIGLDIMSIFLFIAAAMFFYITRNDKARKSAETEAMSESASVQ